MAKVVLDNVSVDFPIYGAHQRSLRSAIAQRATGGLIERDSRNQGRVMVRALSGVSMTLQEGDRVGLVGHNGSGKSTLLKVLAGIYEPVQGRMLVEGRVTPLFDMMPGLDVEDTGYENLFTAGLLLGMSREMVESKIEEIEEFSELGEYLSLPVRTYSAGMTTRLGFALITALNPDILIMDEGFGAADLRFTEKAAERMDDFIGRSRIMVLASHSDGMLQQICNKAALMKEGRLLSLGPVDDILEEYHALVHGKRVVPVEEPPPPVEEEPPPPPYVPVYDAESIAEVGLVDRLSRTSGAVRFHRAVVTDREGRPCWTFASGEPFRIELDYEVMEEVPSLYLLVRFLAKGAPEDEGGVVSNIWQKISDGPVGAGKRTTISLKIHDFPIREGEIGLYIGLGRSDDALYYDLIDRNVALPHITIVYPRETSMRVGMVPVTYEVLQASG